MAAPGPLERARENLVGIVSGLVTAVWMGALFTGQDWWLAALLVGYIAVVPIVSMLFGDEEDASESWAADDVPTTVEQSTDDDDDALATLRARYARGELTDEQFERKLERLLETETIEDIEDRKRRAREGGTSDRERVRDSDRARERDPE